VVTLNFGAQTDGETLNIEFLRSSVAGFGQVSLVGANLTEARVETPTISPPGGSFTDSVEVTLATSTQDAPIEYTIDGGSPTLYTAPFTINATSTVSAWAFFPGFNDSEIATATFTVSPGTGGSLSASTDIAPEGGIGLAGEDWAHWGHDPGNLFEHKAGVIQQIGVDDNGDPIAEGYEVIDTSGGVVVPVQSVDRDTAFSWGGDATHNDNVSDTRTGLRFGPNDLENGDGFSLKVEAGVTEKTLKLYVGLLNAEGTLTASLSDGSATPYVVVLDNPSSQVHQTWVVTLNFGAQTDGETLNIEFLRSSVAGFGQVSLVGATLN
jgi:hypothetical protein